VAGTCQEEQRQAGRLSGEADGNGSGVALVMGGPAYEQIGAVLEEQGMEVEPFAAAAELLERDAAPALAVLQAEGSLSQAVAGNLEALREAPEQTPVVIVCADIRPGELRLALAAGAAGVVLEGQLSSALGPCLAAARAGQVCVPRQHSRQVEAAALSAREKQILGLVVMGYMNSQIADQLFVAESTVKSHLSSAFGKLGVRSRNEAVDLILDPERGLGMGILALGGDPVETARAT
jgi:DNA-binding NarL/FixJ family response regulator